VKVQEAKTKPKAREEHRSKSPDHSGVKNKNKHLLSSVQSGEMVDALGIVKSARDDKKISPINMVDQAFSDEGSVEREDVNNGKSKKKKAVAENRGRNSNQIKFPSISQEKMYSTAKEKRHLSENKMIFNSKLRNMNSSISPLESDDDGVITSKSRNKVPKDWKKNLSKQDMDMANPYLQKYLAVTWFNGDKKPQKERKSKSRKE